MMASIRDFLRGGKRGISSDWLIILVIILVASASFGLGRMSALETEKGELKIGEIELNTVPASVYASQQKAQETNTTQSDGAVLGSKNSDKYHYPWCSGAKRIKEENKIYFASIEDARSAGYLPAGNCSGLK